MPSEAPRSCMARIGVGGGTLSASSWSGVGEGQVLLIFCFLARGCRRGDDLTGTAEIGLRPVFLAILRVTLLVEKSTWPWTKGVADLAVLRLLPRTSMPAEKTMLLESDNGCGWGAWFGTSEGNSIRRGACSD